MTYVALCEDHKAEVKRYAMVAKTVFNEEELVTAMYGKDCSLVILTEPFVTRYLKWITLPNFLEETMKIIPSLRIVIVGQRCRYHGTAAHVININWTDVTAVMDSTQQIIVGAVKPTKRVIDIRNKLLANLEDTSILFNYIVNAEEQVIPYLRQLLLKDEDTDLQLMGAYSALDTFTLENAVLGSQLASTHERYENMKETMTATTNKYNSLVSKINKQYEVPYSNKGEEGFELTLNPFSAILLIKEYTRVKYVDTMLSYVQNILSTLYDTPTRYIVFEKAYSGTSMKLYPNHVQSTELTYRDIHSSDIVTMGYRKDILSAVLGNPGRNRFLIILDRSGVDFLPVYGDRVETLFTFSDLGDNDKYFKIPYNNVISHSGETFNIPHIDGFEEMNDAQKRIEYDEMDIVRNIIKKVELNG